MQQEEKAIPQTTVFSTRSSEELYYAGKQFVKSLIIVIVLAIILYLTHFFSMALTFVFFFIGLILWLATFTYSVGHFVRYLVFSSRKQ